MPRKKYLDSRIVIDDCQHTKRGYETHLSDPSESAATRVKDPNRDLNNPKAHFRPLLGWE